MDGVPGAASQVCAEARKDHFLRADVEVSFSEPFENVINENEPVTLGEDVPCYLSRDKKIFGPHRVGDIEGFLEDGTIRPQDLIWMEGQEEWCSIQETFFLEPPAAAPLPAKEVPLAKPGSAAMLAGKKNKAPEQVAPIVVAEKETAAVIAPAMEGGKKELEPTPSTSVLAQKDSPSPKMSQEEDEPELPVLIRAEPLSNRVWIAIAAGVLAHIVLFCGLVWAAPWLFTIEPYPKVVHSGAPPPLEVALIPEEKPGLAPSMPISPPLPAVQHMAPPTLAPAPPPRARAVMRVPTLPPPLHTLTAPRAMPALLDPPPPLKAPSPPPPQPIPPLPNPVAGPVPTPNALSPVRGTVDAGPSDYLNTPPLDYPPEALRARETGTVILRVVVDDAGNPADVEVERSSGYRILDQSARTQVKENRRFKVGNARVLLVPVSFELDR